MHTAFAFTIGASENHIPLPHPQRRYSDALSPSVVQRCVEILNAHTHTRSCRVMLVTHLRIKNAIAKFAKLPMATTLHAKPDTVAYIFAVKRVAIV